jgi:RNA polymerase sigma-70 factor (ECF subfamily)
VTVDEHDVLAKRFEENRTHLKAVAYRMLGSRSEAEDAVQEAWLRLSRADARSLENLGGWLTTVVARVCLDMLRSRKSRREEDVEEHASALIAGSEGGSEGEIDPEQRALLADSIGLALLVVLETLAPAERVAFVLHDMFAVPFEEIAPIVGRSPTAARQLASRARRRVQGAPASPGSDLPGQAKVVGAFLAAARGGDFDALVAVLDPDVVVRADATAQRLGASSEVRGAAAVAAWFRGRAKGARPVVADGAVGAAWVVDGHPRVVFRFTIAHGKVAAIDLLANPGSIDAIDLVILDA